MYHQQIELFGCSDCECKSCNNCKCDSHMKDENIFVLEEWKRGVQGWKPFESSSTNGIGTKDWLEISKNLNVKSL